MYKVSWLIKQTLDYVFIIHYINYLEVAQMSNHVSEQRITSNVEGNPETLRRQSCISKDKHVLLLYLYVIQILKRDTELAERHLYSKRQLVFTYSVQ